MTHQATTEQRVALRPIRKATRDTGRSLLGGVAAGLADHLAWPVLWVRVGFVVLTAVSGLGAVFYAGLWAALPSRERFETGTPGAESAIRGGRRPGPLQRIVDAGPAVALAVLGIGVLLIVRGTLGLGQIFWPLLIAGGGVALLWRQADVAQRERWLNSAGRVDPVRMLFGQGWQSWVRVGAGSVLLVVAAIYVAWLHATVFGLLITTVLVLAAIAVVVGPFVTRLASDLSAEREERIRTQERADVAAHLHDSVLQTLALIQKNASDAGAVARLARAQERDLRSWLYAGDSVTPDTFAGALRSAAADVEDAHGITVEVVIVGDAGGGSLDSRVDAVVGGQVGDGEPIGEDLRALVAATREALTNAAKHAGVGQVSLYAEVSGERAEVFVRDRGIGFDPGAVAEDRHGLSDSILARMARHGGKATVDSAPGEGTNIQLTIPFRSAGSAADRALGEFGPGGSDPGESDPETPIREQETSDE